MARDINRIDDFCNCLAQQWKRVPDWRFGQFIYNVMGDISKTEHRDIFMPEEVEMLKLIADALDRLTGIETEHAELKKTEDPVTQILNAWNAIPHVFAINAIVPMTMRWSEVQICLNMYGLDGVLEAIQHVAESEWIKKRGQKASFDRYINRNVIQKLNEGTYDRMFGRNERGTVEERLSGLDEQD